MVHALENPHHLCYNMSYLVDWEG